MLSRKLADTAAELKTGSGGACAPLSETLPAARVGRFVRMTKIAVALLASDD